MSDIMNDIRDSTRNKKVQRVSRIVSREADMTLKAERVRQLQEGFGVRSRRIVNMNVEITRD